MRYVYVPFGPFMMAYIQRTMAGYTSPSSKVEVAASAEKAGLGPRTSASSARGIKAGRLKGQVFACT